MSGPSDLKLLAVGDSSHNLQSLFEALRPQGVEVLTAHGPKAGWEAFLQMRPSIVVLDMVAITIHITELLERIVAADPDVYVILVTDHYSAASADEAIRKGAYDYFARPLNLERLRQCVIELLSRNEPKASSQQELLDLDRFEGIVGRSPLMLDVFERVRRVAPHFKTVLVSGATGTGKELVAKALHRLSPAGSSQFAICNCSALVETLLESELFGHMRGSFTGATLDKPGVFEYANGGTVFLDEVGELSPAGQAKLLRVLQNRQVQRIGSPVVRDVDIRVIAATNRDLKRMVRQGQFREDLYYRLAVVDISLPRLSDRREDLPLLTRYFLNKFAAKYQKRITGISRRAQDRMSSYTWPGNVRELENVIENACIMTDSETIGTKDLSHNLDPEFEPNASLGDTLISLDDLQKRHILRVLERVEGNKTRAAAILGIGRATVYQLLSKWKIADTQAAPRPFQGPGNA
jgi:DNA-binding NtrC family response regulator